MVSAMLTDEQRIERAKREIIADIREGKVPETVSTFAELHDYVDANEYGGFCEIDSSHSEWDATVEQANRVQDILSAWLAAGITPDEDCYMCDQPIDLGDEPGYAFMDDGHGPRVPICSVACTTEFYTS